MEILNKILYCLFNVFYFQCIFIITSFNNNYIQNNEYFDNVFLY
jgi:hypothetical protein